MASSDRIDELKRKFDENPRRYFAPLANEFRKGGDLDQAILICQEFLPQQPGHMSGHIVYGQALYESDRLGEARGVFETALSLDPENLIALRHLGDIAGRQGDATTARRWYERVLEADPRNDEIQALLAGLDEPRRADVVTFAATQASEVVPPEAQATPAPPRSDSTADNTPGAVAEPELLDFEVALPNAPSPEPVAAQPSSPWQADVDERMDFESTTIGDIEPAPETAELMPDVHGRTLGFESTEFTAPPVPVAQTPGLQSAFEDETGLSGAAILPLAGLDRPDTTVEETEKLATNSAFPELDEMLPEDRGDVLPPHGDPVARTAAAPATAPHDESLLDFEMPTVEESAETPQGVAGELSTEATADADEDAGQVPTLGAVIPAELPPEVIAAEAELIDAEADVAMQPADLDREDPAEPESIGSELSFLDVGESTDVHSDTVVESASNDAVEASEAPLEEPDSAEDAPVEPRPFVTETMAELYLKQGFRQEALSVYEQLHTSSPDNERLSAKVASLRAEIDAASKSAGPPVREFFARIAARRPGERAAAAAPPAEDDFAPQESSAPVGQDVPPAPQARGEASTTQFPGEQRPSGSIDALFGHQPIGSSENSAASALAQAFGASNTGADAPPIAGNPTREATGELTLDSVFRDGGSRGPRSSQGFSFDQFFSQNVDGDRTSGGHDIGDAAASGEPAERSEDDIEQFNSWLQGLKQR